MTKLKRNDLVYNRKKAQRVCRDIDKLEKELRPVVRSMVKVAEIYDLEIELFETWRSDDRQMWCFDMGYSKTMKKGQHGKRLAVDFVIKIGKGWRWDYKKDEFQYRLFNFLVMHHVASKYPYVQIRWGFKMWGWDMPHYQFKIL